MLYCSAFYHCICAGLPLYRSQCLTFIIAYFINVHLKSALGKIFYSSGSSSKKNKTTKLQEHPWVEVVAYPFCILLWMFITACFSTSVLRGFSSLQCFSIVEKVGTFIILLLFQFLYNHYKYCTLELKSHSRKSQEYKRNSL